ncbi:MAG: phosphoribosylaminoimidazolesuccinocarboxamide synthase [Bacillota bacterium]
MEKTTLLYEGKAKKVFATTDDKVVLVSYKDDATAFNGIKKGQIVGKGIINNRCTNILFKMLEEKGVETHLIEEISETDTFVKKVQIVPLEVIIRNVAAGSFSKNLGIEEGSALKCPVLEFCYKDDALGDPLINDYHALAIGIATEEEIAQIKAMAFKINDILKEFFAGVGVSLIDMKFEFGRYDGRIILADEISPDTCRFWDAETNKKLDKDRFRRDLGGVEEAYDEIMARIIKARG